MDEGKGEITTRGLVNPSGGKVGSLNGGGNAGWLGTPATATTTVNMSAIPSPPAIALGLAASALGGAMFSINGPMDEPLTQHRPWVRLLPRTGAPWHTQRDPPPSTSTGVHRKIGPVAINTPEHDDENGHANVNLVVPTVP